MSTLQKRADLAPRRRFSDVSRPRRQPTSAVILRFADAMIERHGPMASAHAMQRAIDCDGDGDEYGESFWLWVSDLTALAVRREVLLDHQTPHPPYMN